MELKVPPSLNFKVSTAFGGGVMTGYMLVFSLSFSFQEMEVDFKMLKLRAGVVVHAFNPGRRQPGLQCQDSSVSKADDTEQYHVTVTV